MGHNSVTKLRKMTGNNPNLYLVNINAYIKFGQILSIRSQDNEWKRKSDIYLLVSSADNLCKHFRPRSKRPTLSGNKLFDRLMVVLKELF